MEQAKKDELKSIVKRLDDNSSSLKPMEAERLLKDVLEPLLKEDGYVLKEQVRIADHGFDFIAEKESESSLSSESIGIEYKHYKNPVQANAVNQVLGSSIVAGLGRAMLVTNSRFSSNARSSLKRKLPLKLELMDLDALLSWIARVEEKEKIDLDTITIIRRAFSQELIKRIARNSNSLQVIEWRELEYVLAEVFEKLGFGVELTPGSKDGGKDLVLTCRISGKDHVYYVEVKHWRSEQKVGRQQTVDFLNVIVNEEVDGGLFLSTYGQSSSAIESLTVIERMRLKFGDERKIMSLCKTYVRATSEILSADESLSEILYENTI